MTPYTSNPGTLKLQRIQKLGSPYQPLVILGVLFAYITLQGSYIPHICLFDEILHLKCSFCGITHSFEQLLKGNVLRSVTSNILASFLIFHFLMSFIFSKTNRLNLQSLNNRVFLVLVCIQFGLNNAHLISG